MKALQAFWRGFGFGPAGSDKVVFIGDSITQFWSDEDPALFRGGWINRGISGNTTEQMLSRFDRDVLALEPRVVHIMGGTNDLWRGIAGVGAADCIANLIAMSARAMSNDARVILAAPPPILTAKAVPFAQAELFGVVRAALQQEGQRSGLVYTDYADSLCDRAGVMQPAFTTDGVHLSKRGYKAMRRQVEQVVSLALAA